MIDKKMQDALNDQMNKEMYSAYLYLAMSAYFEDLGLKGFAAWMRVQGMEEMSHFKKFYDYLGERGGRILMSQIDGPPNEWKSPLEVFQEVSKHEKLVTDSINSLVDLAIKLKDHASNAMLQWFVTEQVEEEASAEEVVNHLELIGNDKSALFMMDKELGSRIFNAPTGVTI